MDLTLVPTGGLCNRLRVILSGLSLQQACSDIELTVEWERNADCCARFVDLFEPIDRASFRSDLCTGGQELLENVIWRFPVLYVG